jgi:hypothetical protein
MNHELWITVGIQLLALGAAYGSIRQALKDIEERMKEEIADRKKLEDRVRAVETSRSFYTAAG